MLATVFALGTLFRLLYLQGPFLQTDTALTKTWTYLGDSSKLPLANQVNQLLESLVTDPEHANPSLLFAIRTFESIFLTSPFILLLLEQLNIRATFKLRLVHFAVVLLVTSPIAFLWLSHCSLNLALTCLIAAI